MKKLYAIILLGLFSIANALYLTIAAFKYKAGTGSALYCDINSTFSCTNIFGESFSRIFGIPFPLIALLVYPIIILIAIMTIWKKNVNLFKIILGIAIGGVLFNSYIIVNEIMIKVFCPSCLACTFSIVTIGILSFLGMRQKKLSIN